jgi:hypothetical protein
LLYRRALGPGAREHRLLGRDGPSRLGDASPGRQYPTVGIDPQSARNQLALAEPTISRADDPGQVARQGYEALMSGRERVVGGSVKNKVQAALSGVVPDRGKAEQHRKMAEPGSADDG